MKKRDTFQVLIAHPIPEECDRIAAAFTRSGEFSVCHKTHDGLDCLQKAASQQPDLILIHGVLDKLDGLEVLRRLNELPLAKTKRVYITNYNNFLAEHAVLAGADHCILIPCSDETLVRRAKELVLPPQISATDEELNTRLTDILHILGASDRKKGYYYAIDGGRILIRDPKLVMRREVTTELYGTIAKLNELPNSKQVERCLRTLTDRIFLLNSAKTLERYFSPANVQSGHITNTAFLVAISQHVTAQLRAEKAATQGGVI